VAHEQPQVDLVIEHQAMAGTDRDVIEAAVLLMDAMLVAGQRHHLAAGRQRAKNLGEIGGKPDHPFPGAAGDQFRLGDAEFLRRVTCPDPGGPGFEVCKRGAESCAGTAAIPGRGRRRHGFIEHAK
jgi:hypothetical protein